MIKNLSASARDKKLRFHPWVGKVPWRRTWQLTPLCLPGEAHEQRSLVGYSQTRLRDLARTGRSAKAAVIILQLLTRRVCSVAQLCLTLCDPLDYSPPGSTVHGILQVRILEWVAIPSPGGSSLPRDGTCISFISCIGWRILYR